MTPDIADAAVRSAVIATLERQLGAWNRCDIGAYRADLHEDCVTTAISGETFVGCDAVAAAFVRLRKGAFAGTAMSQSIRSLVPMGSFGAVLQTDVRIAPIVSLPWAGVGIEGDVLRISSTHAFVLTADAWRIASQSSVDVKLSA